MVYGGLQFAVGFAAGAAGTDAAPTEVVLGGRGSFFMAGRASVAEGAGGAALAIGGSAGAAEVVAGGGGSGTIVAAVDGAAVCIALTGALGCIASP
jgi:hypothetical protein